MIGVTVQPNLGAEPFEAEVDPDFGFTLFQPSFDSFAVANGGPVLFTFPPSGLASGPGALPDPSAAYVLRQNLQRGSTASLAEPCILQNNGDIRGRGGVGGSGGRDAGYSGGGGGGGAGIVAGAGGAGTPPGADGSPGTDTAGGAGGTGSATGGSAVAPGSPGDGGNALGCVFQLPVQAPVTLYISNGGTIWGGGGGGGGGSDIGPARDGEDGGDPGQPGDPNSVFQQGAAGGSVVGTANTTLVFLRGGASPALEGPIEA